jgi:hypothetical protein
MSRVSRMTDSKSSENPKVISAEPRNLSVSELAMLEAAKQLQAEAISVGRDYNKSMLGVTLSAIGAYLAIITFLNSQEKLHFSDPVMLTPVVLLLIAAATFTIGFHVRLRSWSLELPTDIDQTLRSLMVWRYRAGLYGTSLLLISIALASLLLLLK